MSKVAVVTGGTSGIGLHTAAYLQSQGCTVYTVSRRPCDDARFHHICADVTQEADVARAVKSVLDEAGRIDILVNNAGFGISGAVEFTDLATARRQLDVNFWGMAAMTHAVLPVMRQQGSGRIVNLSSVAAPAAIPFQTYYSVSKAAINDFTLATANEVRPFGITVCAVMPGDICTGFTNARQKIPAGDEIYGGRISRSVAGMEKDERTGMAPEAAGRFVGKVALRTSHKPLYTIGFVYRCCVLLLKLLPARISNWLVGKLYAK